MNRFLFPVAVLLALVGCTTPTKKPSSAGDVGAPMVTPPPPVVQMVNWLPAGSRVAMLPIYSEATLGQAKSDFNGIFRAELIKRLPYEVVQLSGPELMTVTQREQISSAEPVPPDSMRLVRDRFAANAVLFVDITTYRPYRPISMGVRAKLVSLTNFEILWAADRVFDTADPAVAEAALRYGNPGGSTDPAKADQVILQSPRRFAGFVAAEIFSTLPTVQ